MKNKFIFAHKYLTSALFLCLFFSLNSIAAEFKVNKINVLGLQKVDEGVVLAAFPVEPGENFNTTQTSDYIRAIYRTGYFKSITINRDNNNVVIYVKEKPAIASIKIVGNDSFDTETLNKALSSIGIREGGTYDEFTLERLKQELEQQYLSQGKYSVKIKTDVTALERNRIDLKINISEGKVAKIKEIRIIGNRAFSKQELLNDFTLTEGGMLSWFTFSDRYSREKLTGDLEKLKSYYLDRGYLNFKIQDAQISITPDKKNVYIIIQISEGSVYKFGKVELGGNANNFDKTVRDFVTVVNSGDLYSVRMITDIENAILSEFGRQGYLYAKVDINKDVNESNKTVNVTYFVTPGKRVYVRRISIVGNIKTQDEVLRREILQMEGSTVSRDQLELSKQRLAQLGYVKDVNIETLKVPGTNDQVDLKYTLAEESTGHFNGGVGYVENEGFMFNVGLSQDNFLGTGKSLAVNFNKSKAATSSSVSYFDPYFTIDGIGLGYNIYYNKTKLSELSISSYKIDALGADLSLSVPFSLYDNLSVSLGAQNKAIRSSGNSANHIKKFVTQHGKDYNLFPFGLGWRHTWLDRGIMPSKGWKNQLSGNIMIPGSDLNYYLLYNRTQVYIPIYNEFVLYTKANIGYGAGYKSSDSILPFYENYYAGGVGTVRGFMQNSLGPRDNSGDPRGGHALTAGTIELYIPRLFASNIAWRPSIFVDAGNVFKRDIKLDKLRISAGIGLQWLSPMGPLSVSYAKPIKKFKGDEVKSFNFNVGSSF